jgi:hypothetical protein
MTSRLLTVALAVALVLSSSPVLPQGQPVGEQGALSFKVLADQVAALFPSLRTEVIEVAGDRIVLGAGRGSGIQAGVELSTLREGRELIHPTTKKSLGRTEEPLGRVIVTEVLENYAVARQVEGKLPQPGDLARVPGGKVRLSVLALASGPSARVVEAATQELVRELERTGRFQVLLGDQIAAYLAEQTIAPADFMRGKAARVAQQRFKVPHLLTLHFTTVQAKPYVDVRFTSAVVDAPLVQTALFVPASVRARPTQEFSSGGGAGDVRIERRSLLARLLSGDWDPNTYSAGAASIPIRQIATFPFIVSSLDVRLAPGDKVPRLAVTDGQKVYLYRLDGQTLVPEWTYDKLMVGRILSVQLADLNGDGVLDVVVNRQDVKNGMLSYILTTRGGRPAVLADDLQPILFAADETGEGVARALWGQSYNQQTMFSKGGATRFVLKDKDIAAAGPVTVHDQFRALGAAVSNIAGKGSRAVVFVDERSRLTIASGNQELWRSLTPVGGGLARGHLQHFVFNTIVDKFVAVEPNPVALDLDGDGVDEVVVPINEEEAGRMAVVFKGPAGFRMQVVNAGFEGMITGLGAIPREGGHPSLVASVVQRSGLLKTRGETQLLMTLSE